LFFFAGATAYVAVIGIKGLTAAKKTQNSHLRMILAINSVLFLIGCFTLYVYRPTMLGLGIFIALSIFLNLIYWIIPLLRKKDDRPLKAKLSEIYALQHDYLWSSMIYDNFNKRDATILLTLIAIPGLCYFLGKGEAIKKVTYEHVENLNTNQFILRKYGECVIVGHIDLKAKVILPSKTILQMKSQPIIHITPREIGPLTTKD
jgi:hypothetical protein